SAAPAPTGERRFDRPFVDRVEELALLRGAQALLVVGPPGIGKSRLLHELARTESVHVGRCSSYGTQAIAPLCDVVASLGAPTALDGVPAAEVPLVVRRICRRTRHAVVAFDDIQWADGVVLETISHLVAHGVRVIALARDELLERQPTLLPGVARLPLTPLSADDAARLAAGLGGADTVVARAAGNPLFSEQLLAHAHEGGSTLPATLTSLRAARLDQLAQTERRVIACTAVVGLDFDASLVGELLDTATPRRALAALVRRGLLEPAETEAAFEERYRFAHPLIREAAYETTPRAERSRLHERVARLLDAREAADEVVGFHLERACELVVGSDPRRAELAGTAGRRLAAAAMGSFKLGYAAHAAGLFDRAAKLLAAEDPERRELLCELAVASTAAGDRARARGALREARAAADARIRLRPEIEEAVLQQLENAPASARALVQRVDEALPVFADAADERSLGRALLLRGWIEGGVFG